MAADTGLYSEYWNLADVPDGVYEVAARVVCYSGGRLSRPGLGITVSDYVTGLIDRVAPVPESYSPADGIVTDVSVPISVTFSEPINCDLPYTFTIIVQSMSPGSVSGASSLLASYAVQCSGGIVTLSYSSKTVIFLSSDNICDS